MELNHPEDAATPTASLAEYLQTDTFKTHLAAILPDHMASDRFASVCMRQLGLVPALASCSLRSVVGGMMTAATLGLEIGTQGECWLIPYKGEAQLQVGVWGHMALAWRSEQIKDVQVDVVQTGDLFSFRKGSEPFLHHEPRPGRDLDDIDAIEWVYAVVRTLAGGVVFDAFDREWIERIRSRSQAPNSPAWSNFYAEQAQAKALKKVLKLCPKSRHQARAITLDDEADAGAAQTFDIDTSLLLPAEVALDPKLEATRKAMADMGEGLGRSPEPEPVAATPPAAPALRQEEAFDQVPDKRQPEPQDDDPGPAPEKPEPQAESDTSGGLGWD
jgi:recombination protein RecT